FREQVEIVKLLNNFDRTIALHQRKYENLQAVKKELLKRMFASDKNPVPDFRFKGFTDDWEQRKLGDLAEITSASRVHKNEWTSTGVRFLRSSDIVSSFNDVSNTPAFISSDLYSKLIKKSGRPLQGDILITGGGSIGVPYIISQPYPVYFKDADSIWMKQSKSFRSKFMYFFLQSPGYRRYLSQVSHIGTIAHYTIEQVRATPIKLSSINEQRVIEDFLSTLDHTIALHQRKLEDLKQLKKVFLQKLFV
ncbi:restriction endonuclease subunit S, partial [Lacticaseibacillus baoqingensis]